MADKSKEKVVKLGGEQLVETIKDSIYEVLEEELDRRITALQESKHKKEILDKSRRAKKLKELKEAKKKTKESLEKLRRLREQKNKLKKAYERLELMEKKWIQKAVNPREKGEFTRKAEAMGMSVQDYAEYVLKRAREGKWKGDEETVQQAKFAKAAKTIAKKHEQSKNKKG